MTHRNPFRAQYDAANLQRRAAYARSYDWLEIYWAGQTRPSIHDVDGRQESHIKHLMDTIVDLGGTVFRRHDKPVDLREV